MKGLETFPGLLTEFTRVDDLMLIQKYEKLGTNNKGDVFEKTHALLEILLRMGTPSVFLKAAQAHIDVLRDYLAEVVDTLNTNKNPQAQALWVPVAERLGRRLAIAEGFFEGRQAKNFGVEVHGSVDESYGT